MKIEERAKYCPDVLRQKRARAFKAFDIYKQNVAYGVEPESEEIHNRIVSWYAHCLELDQNAIENVPDEVKKYLPKHQ